MDVNTIEKVPFKKNQLYIIFLLTETTYTGKYSSFECIGPLTQLVEYLPFKQRVARSSRARPIKYIQILRPHRLAWSRTPAFHAGNRGSNPLGDATNKIKGLC